MEHIKQKIIEKIQKIYDPEIPVNIYDLGLIYKIDVDEENKVKIDMILPANFPDSFFSVSNTNFE